MFEIDKQKLGKFISELRKEKGYTQNDLAQRLFISDKAISKWETGASIPDTTLLIPLADLLGVTVTELLTYQRIEYSAPIDAKKVEDVVKTAITYTEEEQAKASQNRSQWTMFFFICLFVSCLEMVVTYLKGYMTGSLLTLVGLSAFFGCYFCFFAKTKLPTYYDENRINIYSDGMFRMNVPGVAFNNSNWPHVLQAVRIWAVSSMIGCPLLNYIAAAFLPESWLYISFYVLMILVLGGLFLPVYIVGKKYE